MPVSATQANSIQIRSQASYALEALLHAIVMALLLTSRSGSSLRKAAKFHACAAWSFSYQHPWSVRSRCVGHAPHPNSNSPLMSWMKYLWNPIQEDDARQRMSQTETWQGTISSDWSHSETRQYPECEICLPPSITCFLLRQIEFDTLMGILDPPPTRNTRENSWCIEICSSRLHNLPKCLLGSL